MYSIGSVIFFGPQRSHNYYYPLLDNASTQDVDFKKFDFFLGHYGKSSKSLFSSLSPERQHSDTVVFFYLWVVFCVISSCYTLIWDLKMDWGLFDKNAGENTFLREEIVYPQKVCMECSHLRKKVKKNKNKKP